MSDAEVLSGLECWGFTASFRAQWLALLSDAAIRPGCVPARVLSVRRGDVLLSHPSGEARRAVWRGRLAQDGRSCDVCVGDFVVVDWGASLGPGTVEGVFERRTVFRRKRPGPSSEAQLIAANIDLAIVVCALPDEQADKDALARGLSVRRAERYLLAIREAGAQPLIVVNKADLRSDAESLVATLRRELRGVDVILTSAEASDGLDALERYLEPRTTSVLVGASGVGKSSLTNRLLGHAKLRTQPARVGDLRGRHTTTSRELLCLPSGALLIDTPGMREFALAGSDNEQLAGTEAVLELAGACRFRDCTHSGEPGCAVRSAIEQGTLAAERLEHARELQRELAHQNRRQDAAARTAQRRQTKIIHRALRAALRGKARDEL